MVKWLSNFFDSSDKEFSRIRRVVAQANDEIVELLENQREIVARIREEAFGQLSGVNWHEIQAQEMKGAASEARRLVSQADALRAVIEEGEQTSRDLTVLLADSKQLSAMNAEKNQSPPSERRELEEEIEELTDELGEQLSMLIEERPGLREAILQAVPKARFYPQHAPADEMVKQVEATASFLGREVADYFTRTNETMLALRRAIGLNTLVAMSPSSSKELDRLSADLDASAQELVRALHERDILKHLSRQGLRLPAELKAAAGLDVGPSKIQNPKSKVQTPLDLGEKDSLADELY